ncbi:MAG: CoA transferase [Chloroflexi bacterium]|nr:CoA transferase [Chloroflexota bacterium]
MPLEGIRIVDMSRAQMGPSAATMLADLGADVIKVEPLEGEYSRNATWALYPRGTVDAFILAHNRGKRSLAIDHRHEKGKEVIFKLVEASDVFMQNLRPGAIEALGYGYDMLSKLNSRLIYFNGSGFGRKGPLASWPAYDIIGQAMGGIISVTGGPDDPPTPVGVAIGDQVGAMMVAFGIVTALLIRERTGIGQEVDVSMLDTQLALQNWEITHYLVTGKLPTRRRSSQPLPGTAWPMWRVYRAKDGDLVLGGVTQERWPSFCRLLGLEHVIDDPRFRDWESRVKNRDELVGLLEKAFSQKTVDEWIELMHQADQMVGPVYTYAEVVENPQVLANEMVVSLPHRSGQEVKTVGVPIKFSKTPAKIRSADPEVGQHNEEILLELGYTWDDIAQLKEQKVVL